MTESPYKKLNYFYVDGVPFLPLTKRGNAVNCRIGLSKQLVFIPLCYFNNDLTLKENANLKWFVNKPTIRHQIELYKKEVDYEI